MRKIILTVFFLLFVGSSNAETPKELVEFINQYEGSYHHPKFIDSEGKLMDDLDGVNDLIELVSTEISSGSTDPRVYWLRPTLNNILLLIYRTHHRNTFIELYGTNDNYGPETIKKIKQEIIGYEKALLLNKNASTDEKLTQDMISKILIARSLPAHILEMASRENMSFMEKTGHFENEREVYQQFYFDMINSYIRDKDYDNALRILKEFEGVQSGVLEENLPMLEAHKAKWEKEAIQEAELAGKEKQTEPKKPIPEVSTPQQQPVAKPGNAPQKEEPRQEPDNNMIFIVGIVLVVLLLAGFMVAKRKKK